MISEGDIFLFKFPLTNQSTGKRRPAVLLKKIPVQISDWLVCMVSSRLHHEVQGVDMVVRVDEEIFAQTGFRKDSLIRVTRLAVVDEAILETKIGNLPQDVLFGLKGRLAAWLTSSGSEGAGINY
jgi:mRNA interferase MazF